LKKSKIKYRSNRQKLIFLLILSLFIAIYSWRLFNFQFEQKEGNVEIITTVKDEPTVYNNWQYFDADRYSIKARSEGIISVGDKLQIRGVAKKDRIENPKIKKIGTSIFYKKLFYLRNLLKQKILAYLPEPHSSLLAGVVIGSKEALPKDFKESLQKTGTIHVVVVSGYNISVIGGFVLGLSRYIRRRVALILALILIIFYTLLVGAEAPAVRAAIMGVLAYSAVFLGRQHLSIYALLITGMIMVLVNPGVLTNIGFQLSFLATLGIILFREKLNSFFKLLPKPFDEDLATTIAAQSLVVPVIFYHFGSVSALSPLANALVLWIIPLATILGFILLIVSFLLPLVATFLSWIIWALLSIFVSTIEMFAKIPIASFKFSSNEWLPVIFYYLILAACIWYLKYGKLARTK